MFKIKIDKLTFIDYQDIYKRLRKECLKNIKNWKKTILEAKEFEEWLSEKQRKYYFWVVINVLWNNEQWWWYTLEEIHHEVKILYLPDYEMMLEELWQKNDVTAMMQKFLNLYHDLTITTEKKGNFERFLSRVRAWEAKKWIYIPLPNEEHWWEGAELIK